LQAACSNLIQKMYRPGPCLSIRLSVLHHVRPHLMSTPQPSISVQFVSEWRVRRPHLYRYLEKRFADEFFRTGALRLSSFAHFSSHADEQRLDDSEGKGILSHVNSEGDGQTLIAAMSQGQDAFVLCTSLIYSDELAKAFNTDSGFRVNDIFAFANAISRHVSGFTVGLEGACLYLKKKVLDRDMGCIDIDSWRTDASAPNLDMGRMAQTLLNIAGDDLYFLKSLRYASQSEYRLLWLTSGQMSPFVDIVCPEARQFCTPFQNLRTEMGQ